MTRRQRVGAYALCVDGGPVLLCRMSGRTLTPGTWTLPGGGLQHGEDPVDAVVRELAEETGLTGRVTDLVGIHTNVYDIGGWSIHGVRLLYRVEVAGGRLRREGDAADDTTDDVRWFGSDDLSGLPLSPHAEFGIAFVGR